MIVQIFKFLVPAVLGLMLLSCQPSSPVDQIQKSLEEFPEYSIILQDMKEEGNFFTDYFHQYKLVYGEKVSGGDSLVFRTELTDWYRVPKKEYQNKYNFLGMALISKSADGDINDSPSPPGYQYVGNPRYGQWRTDSNGNSFWEFYGKFAFFSYMFGGLTRPVYRGDWNDYRQYRNDRRPYYGKNKQFGTQGSYTKQTKKSFFDRQKAREASRKSRFSKKFNNRFQRSKSSGMRRRSGGFGK
jgi:hypothetical protein